MIKRKQLTDKQLAYIYNHVLLPTIVYKLQLTIMTLLQCDKMIRPFLYCFKKKIGHAITLPDPLLFSEMGYNLKHLFPLQIENQIQYLQTQFDNNATLERVTKIRCLQLQYHATLFQPKHYCSKPLTSPITKSFNPKFNNTILGGQCLLSTVMGPLYNKSNIFTKFW